MTASWLAAVLGGNMTVAAAAILLRARRLRSRLEARRKELEASIRSPKLTSDEHCT